MRSMFRRNKGLSCDQVMEVLQSYLDGETDAETAKKVATHLDDCVNCDLESSTYKRIKVSLNAQPEAIEPEILHSLREFADRVARGEVEDRE